MNRKTVRFTFIVAGFKLAEDFTPEDALIELAQYRLNIDRYADIPYTFLAELGDGVTRIIHRNA